jgi:acyl dehydratase
MSEKSTVTREQVSLDQLMLTVGRSAQPSGWEPINQSLIDSFADVTGDDAFIHVDPERAATTRFGGTIAHGLLLLSLLPRMFRSATPELLGSRLGVNYGFDRVRFLTPVSVGSRIRALAALTDITEKRPRFYVLTYDITIEIEQQARPAATVRWLLGRWIA